MTTPELVAGVRQLFATAPEERTSRISPRARAPFPPPRAAAPVARVDSSGHAPWKANCCGQRAWPALTRPAGEDALRAQILANFRDRKMARFSDFTPIARPPSPPKVFVRVLFWDEYNEKYTLADDVVLNEDGSLDMTAIAKMWGLKRVAAFDRRTLLPVEPLYMPNKPDALFLSPIHTAILNSQAGGGIVVVEILSDVERKWRQRRLKLASFVKPYKRASPHFWWLPFMLAFLALLALMVMTLSWAIVNRISLLPMAVSSARTGASGAMVAAKWAVETAHPLVVGLWNGAMSS